MFCFVFLSKPGEERERPMWTNSRVQGKQQVQENIQQLITNSHFIYIAYIKSSGRTFLIKLIAGSFLHFNWKHKINILNTKTPFCW